MKLYAYRLRDIYSKVFNLDDADNVDKCNSLFTEFYEMMLPNAEIIFFDSNFGFYGIVKEFCQNNSFKLEEALIIYDVLGYVMIIPNMSLENLVSSFRRFYDMRIFL